MLNVKKVNYDEEYELGCETCDYGSSYVNEIEIILEDGTYTNIKVDKMYDYVLNESDYMNLISNSNNINEFIIDIIQKITNKNTINWLIELEGLEIKINEKIINIEETFRTKEIKYEII